MIDIHTDRLTISTRYLTNDDLEKIVGWLNDAWVMKYSERRHIKHTTISQAQYVENHANYYAGIFLRDGLLIGTMSAEIDEHNKIANVGIMVGDIQHWGKGYGLEAWKAYCDHLLSIGFYKIEGGCASINQKMRKIFRKYDMELEGRRRNHFKILNHRCDLVEYGKINDHSIN